MGHRFDTGKIVMMWEAVCISLSMAIHRWYAVAYFCKSSEWSHCLEYVLGANASKSDGDCLQHQVWGPAWLWSYCNICASLAWLSTTLWHVSCRTDDQQVWQHKLRHFLHSNSAIWIMTYCSSKILRAQNMAFTKASHQDSLLISKCCDKWVLLYRQPGIKLFALTCLQNLKPFTLQLSKHLLCCGYAWTLT